jgi:hypothetical protein
MDREFFVTVFHKHFVPEGWAFLQESLTTEIGVAARQCPFSYKRE